MTIPFSTETINFTVLMGGIAFAIYRSYRDPQSKSETTDAVMREQINNLRLAMETIATNHLPHLDAKITGIHEDVSQLKVGFAELRTTINERIPKK